MNMQKYRDFDQDELESELDLVRQFHRRYLRAPVNTDLARGIPGVEQVELSHAMDGILKGDFHTSSGTPADNYGILDGIPEAKELFGEFLGVNPQNMLVGGNSSLLLMYQYLSFAYFQGVAGRSSAWVGEKNPVTFLCPSPGYDRHFTICEHLGIKMLPIKMLATGPDIEEIEQRVASDASVKGIWCVPKYSNPTGVVYSDEVVTRFSLLANLAGPHFRIMWDNAYAKHDLYDEKPLANLLSLAQANGTQNSVVMFGSSSKITLPGAAVSFLASSRENLRAFRSHLSVMTIGPDKLNQLRHVRFLKNAAGVRSHMIKHAAILRPRFALALEKLIPLETLGIGTFTRPEGGYFVSVTCLPNLAKSIVSYCDSIGLTLTPAGSAFPYQLNPDDNHMRISVSQVSQKQLDRALDAFVNCVKLASLEQMVQQSTLAKEA